MKKMLALFMAMVMFACLVPLNANAAEADARAAGGSLSQRYILFEYGERIIRLFENGAAYNDAVEGATYDADTNTLTLENHKSDYGISIIDMGSDFTVKLVGENEVRFIGSSSQKTDAAIHFAGTGSLSANRLFAYSHYTDTTVRLEVDRETTLHFDEINAECYGDGSFIEDGKPMQNMEGHKSTYDQYEKVDLIFEDPTQNGQTWGQFAAVTATDPGAVYSVRWIDSIDDGTLLYQLVRYQYFDKYQAYLEDAGFKPELMTLAEAEAAGYTLVKGEVNKNIEYISKTQIDEETVRYAQLVERDDDDKTYIAVQSWDDWEKAKIFEATLDEAYDATFDEWDIPYEGYRLIGGEITEIDYSYPLDDPDSLWHYTQPHRESCWYIDEDKGYDVIDSLVRNADDPDGIYVLTNMPWGDEPGISYTVRQLFVKGEGEDSYYSTEGGETYYLSEDEFNEKFSYITRMGDETVRVRFPIDMVKDCLYTTYDYMIKKADDPDGVYAVDNFVEEWGDPYCVHQLTYNDDLDNYVETDTLYYTPEEFEAAGFSYVTHEDNLPFVQPGSQWASVFVDSEGNKYAIWRESRIYRIDEDKAVEILGKKYYENLSVAYDVDYDDLEYYSTVVESERIIYNYALPEYNHTPKPLVVGDADGSGTVNAKDRIILTRYLAKWADYQDIDTSALDVNADGAVNAKDRITLTRYIAKWKGYETLPVTGK